MNTYKPKLGIDIGRVLISTAGESKQDTSFIAGSREAALNTPPYEGMFDVVPSLVRLFEYRVWLISKCGPRVQQRSREWLAHHHFFERTGIPIDHLRFCLQRPQKATHCAELGITHFIDDRLDVLEAMRRTVPNLYLFGPRRRAVVGGTWFCATATWAAAGKAVERTTSARLTM
jgi:hypothetical protein